MPPSFKRVYVGKKVKKPAMKGTTERARRDDRVVEGARLESVCTPQGYRGFESLSLRNKTKQSLTI